MTELTDTVNQPNANFRTIGGGGNAGPSTLGAVSSFIGDVVSPFLRGSSSGGGGKKQDTIDAVDIYAIGSNDLMRKGTLPDFILENPRMNQVFGQQGQAEALKKARDAGSISFTEYSTRMNNYYTEVINLFPEQAAEVAEYARAAGHTDYFSFAGDQMKKDAESIGDSIRKERETFYNTAVSYGHSVDELGSVEDMWEKGRVLTREAVNLKESQAMLENMRANFTMAGTYNDEAYRAAQDEVVAGVSAAVGRVLEPNIKALQTVLSSPAPVGLETETQTNQMIDNLLVMMDQFQSAHVMQMQETGVRYEGIDPNKMQFTPKARAVEQKAVDDFKSNMENYRTYLKNLRALPVDKRKAYIDLHKSKGEIMTLQTMPAVSSAAQVWGMARLLDSAADGTLAVMLGDANLAGSILSELRASPSERQKMFFSGDSATQIARDTFEGTLRNTPLATNKQINTVAKIINGASKDVPAGLTTPQQLQGTLSTAFGHALRKFETIGERGKAKDFNTYLGSVVFTPKMLESIELLKQSGVPDSEVQLYYNQLANTATKTVSTAKMTGYPNGGYVVYDPALKRYVAFEQELQTVNSGMGSFVQPTGKIVPTVKGPVGEEATLLNKALDTVARIPGVEDTYKNYLNGPDGKMDIRDFVAGGLLDPQAQANKAANTSAGDAPTRSLEEIDSANLIALTKRNLEISRSIATGGSKRGSVTMSGSQPIALGASHIRALTPYLDMIETAANAYGLPEDVLMKKIWQESGGNPNAVSKVGAQGLAQLMPGTAKDLGVSDPNDPAQAVDGGARYLKQMTDTFGGDINLGLLAYNMGPGNLEKVLEGKMKIPAESDDYLFRIMGISGSEYLARLGVE